MRAKKTRDPGPYVTKFIFGRDRVESFDKYPFSLPVVREFQGLALHPSVTFLVGPNCSGKSTLLEAIAVAMGFNAEGGGKNFNFSTLDSHSVLDDYPTVVKTASRPPDSYFFRAESYYNLATEIDNLASGLIGSYGGVSLHAQSHGESFLALIKNRFYGGFYVLDEPEAALSPDGVLSLIAGIHELVKRGSQFLIATHSPILVMYPHSEVYEIQEGKLVLTPFDQTRHFQLTRDLLNRPYVIARDICERPDLPKKAG